MKFLTRLTVFLSFLIMVQNAYAASNNIYVDQIGSGSIINMTQTGSGNNMGTQTSRVILNGDTNLITVDQIGNSNSADIKVEGDGNTISSQFTGDSNQLSILCTFCSMVGITDTVMGSGNEISHIIDSSGGTSTVNVGSDNNTVSITNDSSAINGSSSNVDISGGNGNEVSILQTGVASTMGHYVDLTIDGATNSVLIEQGGAVDSNVSATITGSGNTVDIRSNR